MRDRLTKAKPNDEGDDDDGTHGDGKIVRVRDVLSKLAFRRTKN